jgi:ABC-type transport system involved in Fe-S cluster assembly fused permease/ATPase subunit
LKFDNIFFLYLSASTRLHDIVDTMCLTKQVVKISNAGLGNSFFFSLEADPSVSPLLWGVGTNG